ncbi:MAG: ABC-2 transporter permease [Clostridium sp.]|jgi:ABC-2 type transport system permease protein
MKGLLIKDFRLMKLQMGFFGLCLIFAVFITFTGGQTSFPIGYLTFIGSLYAVSSLNYDSFDNGFAFLFTLPITRKEYVFEKYIFSILASAASWLLAVSIAVAATLFNPRASLAETLWTAACVLPMIFLLISVTLPFHLKFGSEKGRIAILAVIGAFFAVITAAASMAGKLADHAENGPELERVLSPLSASGPWLLILPMILLALVALVFSLRLSISILQKKEF